MNETDLINMWDCLTGNPTELEVNMWTCAAKFDPLMTHSETKPYGQMRRYFRNSKKFIKRFELQTWGLPFTLLKIHVSDRHPIDFKSIKSGLYWTIGSFISVDSKIYYYSDVGLFRIKNRGVEQIAGVPLV